MNNNQPTGTQKNDQNVKPIIIDDKAEAAKKAEEAAKAVANDTKAKPADAAKTGTA